MAPEQNPAVAPESQRSAPIIPIADLGADGKVDTGAVKVFMVSCWEKESLVDSQNVR